MKIIVISVKRHSDLSKIRTKLLIDKIKSFGIDVNGITFLGVYGDKLKDKHINKNYVSERFVGRKVFGTLGCTLSHACALKFIQSKDIHSDVFILEEDAILNENIFNFFYNYKLNLNQFPSDYDMIFLHCYHRSIFYNQIPNLDKKTLANNVINVMRRFPKEFPPDHNVFRKIINLPDYRTPPGTQCYVVNGANIKNIIKYSFPFSEAIDWSIWTPNPYLNKYIINPKFKLLLNPPSSNETSIRTILDNGRNFLNT